MDAETATKVDTERVDTRAQTPRAGSRGLQCPFLGPPGKTGFSCRARTDDDLVIGDRYAERYCHLDAHVECNLYQKADVDAWQRLAAVGDGSAAEDVPERGVAGEQVAAERMSIHASSLHTYTAKPAPRDTRRGVLVGPEPPQIQPGQVGPEAVEVIGEPRATRDEGHALIEAQPVVGDSSADVLDSPNVLEAHLGTAALIPDEQPLRAADLERDPGIAEPVPREAQRIDPGEIARAVRLARERCTHGSLRPPPVSGEHRGRTHLATAPLPNRPLPSVSHPAPANEVPNHGGQPRGARAGTLRLRVLVTPFLLAAAITGAALVFADTTSAPGISPALQRPHDAIHIHSGGVRGTLGLASAKSWQFPALNGPPGNGVLLVFNPGKGAVDVTIAGRNGMQVERARIGSNESAQADLVGDAGTGVLKVSATGPVVVQRAVVRRGAMQPVQTGQTR